MDWRPGEPVVCKHPSNVNVADIIVLQSFREEDKIIYADKQFGKFIKNISADTELWEYPVNLAMTQLTAASFLKKKHKDFRVVYSSYQKKIAIDANMMLDAAIAQSVQKLGTVTVPTPALLLPLLNNNWIKMENKWKLKNWEEVAILLHNPKIVTLKKGELYLEQEFLPEACCRLLKIYLIEACKKCGEMLTKRKAWPTRSIENLVAAKFKKAKTVHRQIRKMPPCVKAALQSQDPLDYQLRFQLAEVFSYGTLEMLNQYLEPRLIIDGKHRQQNIRACFFVARKKKADQRPCVTRTKLQGLYCVHGGGLSGVEQCAKIQGFQGNLETVSISQMWGLQN